METTQQAYETTAAEALPTRQGPRPRTTSAPPHTQLDQQPAHSLTTEILAVAEQMPGVVFGWSRRAPEGTVGLYLERPLANGPEQAFMLDTEFAHAHPTPDFSFHLTLPEPLRSEAIEAGWVEPHPMAGYPGVSGLIVLMFAPRDLEELAVAQRLVNASWAYARGEGIQSTAVEP